MILLVSVNAGYIHSAIALRCLAANMGDLAPDTRCVETDAKQETPVQLAARLLASGPSLVGFAVYIWNVPFVHATISVMRRVAPGLPIVVGGPQITAENAAEEWLPLVDAAIVGEGEGVIRGICERLLAGERSIGAVVAAPPDLNSVALPYDLYTDDDIAHRVIYAESSRGCPFACEYCTSSNSGGIRAFPLPRLFAALDRLLARGARRFKFLDRSFNCNGEAGLAVLDFFLARPEVQSLHFEFIPALPDDAWRRRLLAFRPGQLHLEVGIQTWDEAVARRIRRPLNAAAAEATIRFLVQEARADVHADLIFGLPGETPESMAAGFDRLVRLCPAELQAGILKCLPGTAIRRHETEFGLVFSPEPPFEILQTSTVPFAEMQRLSRFAHCWDLLFNRGRFRTAAPLLWSAPGTSPFAEVMAVADFLHRRNGRVHGLSPRQLASALVARRPNDPAMRAALEADARAAAHPADFLPDSTSEENR